MKRFIRILLLLLVAILSLSVFIACDEKEGDEDDWDEDEKKYLPLNMLNTVRMPNFMKIALTVAVQDKKGKTYSFEETLSEYDDDRDIWCSFNYDLNSLLVKSIIRKFNEFFGP